MAEFSFAAHERFRAQIAADRERLKIQPVTLHKMPPWAKKRLLIAAGNQPLCDAEYLIPGPRVFDHFGCSPSGSLVGEPYCPPDDPSLLVKVRKIAGALGVSWSIGNPWSSWWFPGLTTRVEFFETANSEPIEQLRIRAKAAQRRGKTLFEVTQ